MNRNETVPRTIVLAFSDAFAVAFFLSPNNGGRFVRFAIDIRTP